MHVSIDWPKVLPVIVSIVIIIAIAILRQYSKNLSAIVATMPLNIPLGMWITYAGADQTHQQAVLQDFSGAVLINIIPTLIFMLVAWLLAKQGHSLLVVIGIGYIGWAISLGILLLIKQALGTA